MKILVVHNMHRKGSASGDDQVFKSEVSLLRDKGNEVIEYTANNDEFDGASLLGKIKLTLSMFWSFKHYRNIKKVIRYEKPDLMHVHTFFPLLSPSILYAAKREGVKVVATLHDTRLICPCAVSLRGTELCSKCGDGHYFRMCKYACYKKSRVQSFVVAAVFWFHRKKKSFYNQIDKYICLNDNQINMLRKIGFDSNKIVKKYNYVYDVELPATRSDKLFDRYVVYYGRIGEEKGIHWLMKIWDKIEDIPLVVMGAGPLDEEFAEWAQKKDNVLFLGYTERNKCLSIVEQCEFVVFPSICYEGCSMVVIETECMGKAIVATDLGFSVEAIKEGKNGYRVPLNDVDAFVEQVRKLWGNPQKCIQMGINARNDYEQLYTPENNYEQLMDLYKKVINE